MASNLKRVDRRTDKIASRNVPSDIHADDSGSSFWHLRLKFGHVVVFWSVIAGTLVSTFLMGLFAGRTQGVDQALREQSDISLRLPLKGKNELDVKNQARASLGPKILDTLKNDVDDSQQANAFIAGGERGNPLAESEDNLAPGWYVQIVAANVRKEAEELENRLIQANLPAVVQKARLKKIEYFRVLSGPFESRVVAAQKRIDIKSLELSASAPFIRQVY